MADNAEATRLNDDRKDGAWRQWGAYLSNRQWGTVREDYSANGTAWDYFPHDHARSRAYRWGEDGILGWCDNKGRFNIAPALWNGVDPILKERLFGLTNSEGNHGEDVKEIYFYLDGTPTGSYMKGSYIYPQQAYPYDLLVRENHQRTQKDREFELVDTGVLEHGWWELMVEYAKPDPTTTYGRYTITNHGPSRATVQVLIQGWYRNRWSWELNIQKPKISRQGGSGLLLQGQLPNDYHLVFEGEPELIFTENETNKERIFGCPNTSPFVKDAFHRYVIHGEKGAINTVEGTKVAARYSVELNPGESKTIRFVLSEAAAQSIQTDAIDLLFAKRIEEADQFYENVSPELPDQPKLVHRQAFAGMNWCKQYYHFDVDAWLNGDPNQPPPPPERKSGRDCRWRHLRVSEVISMPDNWEYPWFAAWDLAFQAFTFALIDPDFAKHQLLLLEREWMMHPNGQIPAYEWAFEDVNPPVQAWATWRVYTIDRKLCGQGDRKFLEKMFLKLLLNFTWWVNRKDSTGDNVFEGGFLGLDNIGVFDRNMPLPDGLILEQSDGTSWMAMFCIQMLTIALELADEEKAYEEIALKFFEHFLYIAGAMSGVNTQHTLWDEQDGFYYDAVQRPDGQREPIRLRSAVGLIPLFAITTLDKDQIESLPKFKAAMEWFLQNRPELTRNVASMTATGQAERRLLSIVSREQLERILERMLDPAEFLSDFGIRMLSKTYEKNPFTLSFEGRTMSVDYEPGESTSGLFGGNSNWRGPIWFPINYLLIESLQQFDYYYGNEISVELPAGSRNYVQIDRVVADLEQRLTQIFLPTKDGIRPVHDGVSFYKQDGPWKDRVMLYEYFHGDTGRGVGANHQTGWTGLIAKIIQQRYITAYADMVD